MTLKPPTGALRVAPRRMNIALTEDTYYALLREQKRRIEEVNAGMEKDMVRYTYRDISFSIVIEDALISYLGVGGEEE